MDPHLNTVGPSSAPNSTPTVNGDSSPARVTVPPPRDWSELPEELVLLVSSYLCDLSRISCARVCRQWRNSIISNAFDGLIHLKSETESKYLQNFIIERLSLFARGLFFFDLTSYETAAKLGEAADRCDSNRLRTLVIMGDQEVGAFRVTLPSEGDGFSESLVLPSLSHFLRGKKLSLEKWAGGGWGIPNTSPKISPQYLPQNPKRRRNSKNDQGFSLEHFGLIDMRLTSSYAIYLEGDDSFWASLHRHSGESLRRLDLIHFTDHMYLPFNLFALDALEQLCISPNHLSCVPLPEFAGLKSLNHLIVYVGFARNGAGVTLDSKSLKKLCDQKPRLRLSFIAKTLTDVQQTVPADVPLHGLEIVNILERDKLKNASDSLRLKLRRVERLAIINPPRVARELLQFFQHLSLDDGGGGGGKNGVGPLPRLERFQLGGDYPADVYLNLAQYVRSLSLRLSQWLVYFDEETIARGPHSVLGHHSRFNVHLSRLSAVGCDAPADDLRPLVCSTSDMASFRRALAKVLPPSIDLRVMTKRAFLGTSLFWAGQNMEVLRRTRISSREK